MRHQSCACRLPGSDPARSQICLGGGPGGADRAGEAGENPSALCVPLPRRQGGCVSTCRLNLDFHLRLLQAAELRAKSTRWFDWVKNTRQQLDAAKRELQQVRSSATRAEVWEFEQKLKLGEGNVHNAKDQADAIWKEADVLIAGSAVHVLERAEVVVATLAGSADQVLRNSKFKVRRKGKVCAEGGASSRLVAASNLSAPGLTVPCCAVKVVVIDEASQATEPTTFIPLVKGAEMVVMAGDPNQLPPTILSQAAINRCSARFGVLAIVFCCVMSAAAISRDLTSA